MLSGHCGQAEARLVVDWGVFKVGSLPPPARKTRFYGRLLRQEKIYLNVSFLLVKGCSLLTLEDSGGSFLLCAVQPTFPGCLEGAKRIETPRHPHRGPGGQCSNSLATLMSSAVGLCCNVGGICCWLSPGRSQGQLRCTETPRGQGSVSPALCVMGPLIEDPSFLSFDLVGVLSGYLCE